MVIDVGPLDDTQDFECFRAVMLRDRPTEPFVYPPTVYDAHTALRLQEASERLCALVADMPSRVFGDDRVAWIEFLGVEHSDEAALLHTALDDDGLVSAATAFMRPDVLLTDSGFKVVEVNTAAPIGGITHHGPYAEAFMASEYRQALAGRSVLATVPDIGPRWLAAFESGLRRATRTGHVFLAIADPTDPNLGSHYYTRLLRSVGYTVSTGLVSELAFTPHGAVREGRRIDAVLTMYTWLEACEFVPSQTTRRLLDLHREERLDLVGSPVSAAYDHKANLELLTSDAFRQYLSAEETALVRELVPATVRVVQSNLDQLLKKREELVLKPGAGYAGIGLTRGWTCSDAEWRIALQAAADRDETYVCQERVRMEPVYTNTDGEPVNVCFGPLVLMGSYAGTFTRELPKRSGDVVNARAGAIPGAMVVASQASLESEHQA